MIIQKIRHWAKQTPDATAIEAWSHEVSYRTFFQLIQTTRKFLETQGLQPNSVCVLWAGDILDQWVMSLAARSLGINVITLPIGEVKVLESLQGATALLLPQADFARIASQHMPNRIRKIMVPTAIYAAPILEQTNFDLPKVPAGDHFCLSSGSTGSPKLVRFKADTEEDFAAGWQTAYKNEKRKVALINYPIYGSVGYKWGITRFHDGGSVVIEQKPATVATLRREDVFLAPVRPEHIRHLLPQLIIEAPIAGLTIRTSGGHVPFDHIQRMRSCLSTNIFNCIGSTELASEITITQINTMEDLVWSRVRQGRTVEVVDEHDRVLPAGQEGKLRVKLQRLDAKNYEGDPKATQETFRDGFFYTGDLAILAPDGRLKLTGRTGDTLAIGSAKLSTAWLENDFATKLGARVCLFSKPGQGNTSEVHVVIEGAHPPAAAQDAIKNMLRGADAVYFHNLAAFPVNTGHKIDRINIRKSALGEA